MKNRSLLLALCSLLALLGACTSSPTAPRHEPQATHITLRDSVVLNFGGHTMGSGN